MSTLTASTPDEPDRIPSHDELVADIRRAIRASREKAAEAVEPVRARVRQARRPIDKRMAAPNLRAALRKAVGSTR